MEADPGIWVQERYVVLGPYGEGGCSEVDWGWDTKEQKWIVIKKLHQTKWEKVSHEIECSRKFNLPQCVKCIDWFELDSKFILVFDYIDHLPLREVLPKFQWCDIQRFTGQLLWLLNQFHTGGMIHRDLKPSNLLLDRQTLDIRLIDYGMCLLGKPNLEPKLKKWGNWTWEPTSHRTGTPAFLAPEQEKDYETSRSWIPTPAIDIWAVGCILMEWWTGKGPFFSSQKRNKKNIWSDMWQKRKWNDEWIKSVKRPDLPENHEMEEYFSNFVSLCFTINPERRPNTKKLLQHKFIQNGSYQSCLLFQSVR